MDLFLLSNLANVYLCLIYIGITALSDPFDKHKIINFMYILSAHTIILYGPLVLLIKALPQRFIKQKLEPFYRKIRFKIHRRGLEESFPYRLEQSERDALLN